MKTRLVVLPIVSFLLIISTLSEASASCKKTRYWSGTQWRIGNTCTEQIWDGPRSTTARQDLWCNKPGYIQCASSRCPGDLNACSYRCLCE